MPTPQEGHSGRKGLCSTLRHDGLREDNRLSLSATLGRKERQVMNTWKLAMASVAVSILVWFPTMAGAQGTLFVEGDNVGIGTATPAIPLHILRSTGADTTEFRLENNGGNRFDFVNTLPTHGGWWQFINSSNPNGADLVIREITKNGLEEFRMTETGNITISGSLFHNSSREAKLDIEPIDARSVLEQVVGLPIAEWSYKTDARGVRHLGPMAEDFFATFGLGGTEKAIATNDTSGVALAAIQGLHAELAERDQRIAKLVEQQELLESANGELERRLHRLERAIQGLE